MVCADQCKVESITDFVIFTCRNPKTLPSSSFSFMRTCCFYLTNVTVNQYSVSGVLNCWLNKMNNFGILVARRYKTLTFESSHRLFMPFLVFLTKMRQHNPPPQKHQCWFRGNTAWSLAAHTEPSYQQQHNSLCDARIQRPLFFFARGKFTAAACVSAQTLAAAGTRLNMTCTCTNHVWTPWVQFWMSEH